MRRTSRKITQNYVRVTVLTLCLVFVMVLLLLRPIISDISWWLVAPLLKSNPLTAIEGQFASKTRLESENAQLRFELASTTATLADRELLYRENLYLKNALGRDAARSFLLAGVILRPPGTPYDTLIIDAGRAEGVTIGDAVSAGGTTLIGTVDEVSASTARVVLFSAPGESYQAILTQTGQHAALPVQVDGQGGGSMIMEVPAHTLVEVGDSVVIPGILTGLTGVVSHVESTGDSSFESVYMHVPVDPMELQYVEVIER